MEAWRVCAEWGLAGDGLSLDYLGKDIVLEAFRLCLCRVRYVCRLASKYQ